MRPIGAWFFGRMADRHGRRVALTTSVLLMCFGSGLIAVTPVYATIGFAAPVILLLARMIQGLSLGGEYGTSATYLSEMATADRRGFYSSFQYVTLIGGQLTAMLVLIVAEGCADACRTRRLGLAHSVRDRRGPFGDRVSHAPRSR